MKDAFGKELQPGDEVIYARNAYGRSVVLKRYLVVKVNERTATVQPLEVVSRPNYPAFLPGRRRIQMSARCFKL